MKRVWISAEPPTCENYCAVWIELGDGRLAWILDNGDWGFTTDVNELSDPDDVLTNRLESNDAEWERIA